MLNSNATLSSSKFFRKFSILFKLWFQLDRSYPYFSHDTEISRRYSNTWCTLWHASYAVEPPEQRFE